MVAQTGGIQRKILLRILAVSVLPVIALGIAAFTILNSLSRETERSVADTHDQLADDLVGDELERSAEMIRSELLRYIDERIADTRTWAGTPTVREAAASGASVAVELGLTDVPITALEAQFGSTRQLPGASQAAQYLVDEVRRSPYFAEVFFTNVYGHNVGGSGLTSDFVQSDEVWWQNAWDRGLDLGAVEFDESAGVLSTDIALRIEDPLTATPLGVMKAVLDVSIVQDVADRFASSAEVDVTILTGDGRLLAETASDHAVDRIAIEGVELDEMILALYESARSRAEGHELGDDSVYGYSSTSAADTELDWTVIVEQPNEVAFASIAGIRQLSDDLQMSTDRLSIGLLIVLVGVIALALTVSFLLARGIVGPLRDLRDAANDVAELHLPRIVESLEQADDISEQPIAPLISAPTGDEVEQLAAAFNSVQATAVRLASEQAEAKRRNIAHAFVNMGRRDRNLLRRQAAFIAQLQRREPDDEKRAELAQLAQLALRLQRNAENLLVLAGEESPAIDAEPVPIADLFDSAGSVLGDYGRVELAALDPVEIHGPVVSDVAHLVAELLENALAFSSSDTTVSVVGKLDPEGYRISITDHGIGIAALELTTANGRLHRPLDFNRSPETRLGLFVVGRLASRHGIFVELRDGPVDGITAELTIPLELVNPRASSATDPAAESVVAPTSMDLFAELASPVAPEVEPAHPASATKGTIWPSEFSPVEEVGGSPIRSSPGVERTN